VGQDLQEVGIFFVKTSGGKAGGADVFVWMLSLFLLGGGNWSLRMPLFRATDGSVIIPVYASAGEEWESLQFQVDLCRCRGELMIDSVTLSGNGEMTTFWDRGAGKFDVRMECYPRSDEASGEGNMRSLAIGIEARRGCIAPLNDEIICIIWANVRHGRDSLPVAIDSVLSCEPREEISCGFLDARGEFHKAHMEGGVIVREF